MPGHITATSPGALPKLERIAIAINSHGHLKTGGIPSAPPSPTPKAPATPKLGNGCGGAKKHKGKRHHKRAHKKRLLTGRLAAIW